MYILISIWIRQQPEYNNKIVKMQSSKNPPKPQLPKKPTGVSHKIQQQNQITYLLQSIQREKYSKTASINLNSSIDKQNQQFNQGRYSYAMRVQNQKRDGRRDGMVRSGFLGNGGNGGNGDGVDREFREFREIKEMREMREKERGCIVDAKLIDSMVYKIKKYLAVTEALIKNPDKIEQKLRKQAINTACELLQTVNSLQQSQKRNKQQSAYSSLNSTGKLVLGQNKSLSASYHFPSAPQPSLTFIRKIQNLQQQKYQLQSIISQNERQKIKMIIKFREGQSEQIQKYKKQLSSLFEKYKQLEKLVKKECEKSKQLQMIVDSYQYQIKKDNGGRENGGKENGGKENGRECGRVCQLGLQQMRRKIGGLEAVVNQQNQYLARALEQIQRLKAQIKIYENMEAEYTQIFAQLQKKQKPKAPKILDPKPINDSKSTCSSQFGFDPTHPNTHPHNPNHNHNNNPHNKYQSNSDTGEPFANITLKTPHYDESMLRMMLAQASYIDSIYGRR